MPRKKLQVREPSRRIPVAAEVDVLVAGGGPAGIAAGIAAAREGARTLVVERYGYLGGMVTGAHVTWVMGVGDGLRPKARGIIREIRQRLEPLGAISNPTPIGEYHVDAEVFKWQAIEMLQEAGADVLLHTWACAPILSREGAVAGVFAESKSGRRALLAKVVVDATADADLAFRAGCACDDATHDVSLRIVLTGVDAPAFAVFEKAEPERCQAILAEARRLNGGHLPNQAHRLPGLDVADATALTKAEISLRCGAFRALQYLRANLPGWENAAIKETGAQLGVRQGRRVRGVYVLTDADIRASRHCDDSIARLGACMDGYQLYKDKGLDYDLPYRCLVPEQVDGLLVAGRCVSSDYLACNTLRLIVPCLATGQAAGVAAAIAARAGVSPRQVPYDRLRAALLGQDVYLGDPSQPEEAMPETVAAGAAPLIEE